MPVTPRRRHRNVHIYSRNSPSWNPRVHSRVDTSPSLVRILSQINPFHAPSVPISISFRYGTILSSLQRPSLPGVLFPSGFAAKTLYMFSFSISVTYADYLILLDFATRIITAKINNTKHWSMRSKLIF